MHWIRETPSAATSDKMDGDRKKKDSFGDGIYHEKQTKELCALHALNNLFQDRKAFTKKGLDEICITLSPDHFINPHRSIFGLGNYDVNVIMAALQTKQCETIWFDKRKDIDCLEFRNIKGLILNIPTEFKLGVLRLPIKRKHWIAIREIAQEYYNFDSKLSSPESIGKEDDMKTYLRDQLQNRDAELLLVVSQDVCSDVSWKKDSLNSTGVSPVDSDNVASSAKETDDGHIINRNS